MVRYTPVSEYVRFSRRREADRSFGRKGGQPSSAQGVTALPYVVEAGGPLRAAPSRLTIRPAGG